MSTSKPAPGVDLAQVEKTLSGRLRLLRFPSALEAYFEAETGKARSRELVWGGLISLLIYDLASRAVIKALAEVSFEGPRGVIQMSKQRHAPLTMYLGQVQGDGGVKVLDSFKDVDPGEQCPNLK